MRCRSLSLWPALMLMLALGTARPALAEVAVLATIDGPIGPATTEYVENALERAVEADAEVLILRMDTPGGLAVAMRDIIQAILASPVPVIGYVAPPGSRAASAGTYILYASHVAAMAPATNLGAATPVSIGGGGGDPPEDAPPDDGEAAPGADDAPSNQEAMRQKIVNDSVAYIRSLAERRGRNADWAEKAVREGASLTASAALERGVIDLIAEDVPALLAKVDGREIDMARGTVTLDTAGLQVEEVEPGWRVELLSVVTNPTVAYLLMMAGIIGLVLELLNPGAVFPGVIGAICLLVALFAFQILPVNFAGLGLIALGVGLLVAEALVPSFGILGFGGIAAFVFGSVMLMDTDVPGYGISIGVIVGVALAAAGALALAVYLFWRSRRQPVVTGDSGMLGAQVQALEDFDREGWVRAHGETWRARSNVPLRKGDHARVTRVDGLTLTVQPENGDKPHIDGRGAAP